MQGWEQPWQPAPSEKKPLFHPTSAEASAHTTACSHWYQTTRSTHAGLTRSQERETTVRADPPKPRVLSTSPAAPAGGWAVPVAPAPGEGGVGKGRGTAAQEPGLFPATS